MVERYKINSGMNDPDVSISLSKHEGPTRGNQEKLYKETEMYHQSMTITVQDESGRTLEQYTGPDSRSSQSEILRTQT